MKVMGSAPYLTTCRIFGISLLVSELEKTSGPLSQVLLCNLDWAGKKWKIKYVNKLQTYEVRTWNKISEPRLQLLLALSKLDVGRLAGLMLLLDMFHFFLHRKVLHFHSLLLWSDLEAGWYRSTKTDWRERERKRSQARKRQDVDSPAKTIVVPMDSTYWLLSGNHQLIDERLMNEIRNTLEAEQKHPLHGSTFCSRLTIVNERFYHDPRNKQSTSWTKNLKTEQFFE